MIDYVLITIPIVVVENFKCQIGYTNSSSKILRDKLITNIFFAGALRFRGVNIVHVNLIWTFF